MVKFRTVSHVVFSMTYTLLCYTEDKRPTMKELNRYVMRENANKWEDIGKELGLALDKLKITAKDNPLDIRKCFLTTLDQWLKENPGATWRTLEIALTNVNRAKLGLDSVDDLYGKDVYFEFLIK